MQIHAEVISTVGYTSFADGFVPLRANLFDEVRENPQAVCARLMNCGEWQLAEWVMDLFVTLPSENAQALRERGSW